MAPGPLATGLAALVAALDAAILAGCATRTGVASGNAGQGAAISWRADACAAAAIDADRHGLDDRCELDLARTFAPELLFDPRDCLWDPGAGGSDVLAGGYAFVAQPAPGTRAVRIAYMPAYFRDCGWVTRAACLLRRAPCSAHAGDSELIVLDVVHDPGSGRWTTDAVFLSAHCYGRSGHGCRWYRGGDLAPFVWADGRPRGAPRVWVSRGKHANYPSRRACGSGHWLRDSCAGRPVARRFPIVGPRQNAGSRRVPFPEHGGDACVRPPLEPPRPHAVDPSAVECLWSEGSFRGWQPRSVAGTSTGYGRYLRDVAGF